MTTPDSKMKTIIDDDSEKNLSNSVIPSSVTEGSSVVGDAEDTNVTKAEDNATGDADDADADDADDAGDADDDADADADDADDADNADDVDEEDDVESGAEIEEDGAEDDDDDEIDIDDDGNIGPSVPATNPSSGEKMKLVGLDDLDGDGDIDLDDEDDLEYDPDILKKLDTTRDIISKIHPEHVSISTEELNSLVKVVRNKDKIIIDDLHRSYPVLTKYERVRVIGQRVKQLNSGCPPYITTEKHIDNYIIAEQELKEKILPIIIRRPIPSGGCEYWRLQDLEIL